MPSYHLPKEPLNQASKMLFADIFLFKIAHEWF